MNNEETKIVAEIAERFERLCTNKNEECISNYQDVFSCALEVAEWMKQQMVEKTAKWLKENADKYVGRELEEYDMQYYGHINKDNLIEDFKQAMKEE